MVVTHLTSVSQKSGMAFTFLSFKVPFSMIVTSPFFVCTQNCLHSVLEHIAVYGQAVFRLQRFIDEVTGYSSEPCLPSSGSSYSSRKGCEYEPPFRTYQAFVWALNKYFTSFKEELTTIERELICNGKFKIEKYFTVLSCTADKKNIKLGYDKSTINMISPVVY